MQSVLTKKHIIFPGGALKIGNERIILEPSGSFRTVDDLKSTIVSAQKGKLVYLGDITNIYRDYVDPKASLVRINGETGLAIGISLKRGGNIMNLGEEIDKKIEYYKQIYPIGIEIERVASQDFEVDKQVKDFISNLLQAVIVVLAVMLLFLGFRTGLLVASLIPTAIIMTIFLLPNFGVGLNTVSLASLIIALGMLVDNAIVMSESILVKMEKGEKPLDAAISSAKELILPLLIASLTTAAAFLAFFLAESVMGEIVGEIFIVVATALLCSWLLSLTMITMLCVYFLKAKKKTKGGKKRGFDFMKVYYRDLLIINLRKPVRFIIITFIIFCIAMWGMSFVPFIFLPDSERAVVSANIELPLGINIERTDEVIREIEEYIKDSLLINKNRERGVVTWSTYIGEGAPKYDLGYMPPEAVPNAAHILMNTTSGDDNQMVIDKLDAFCFRNYPEMTARVSRLLMGGGSIDPIAVRISGKDPEKLYDLVDSVKLYLSGIEGSKNVKDSWGMRTKKFIVNINQARAKLAGLTSQDIAVSLNTVLSGAEIGQFREEDKVIPIIMRNPQSKLDNIGKLESLNIYAQQTGKNVPLKQVADIEVRWQASKILRRDLNRTVTVSSGLEADYTAAAITSQLSPWLAKFQKDWTYGYTYNLGGEAEDSAEGMKSVTEKLPLSFFIILLLLIGQFNSIRKAAIILLTIPLGLIGVTIGLLITDSYYGFMSFLGLISLAGIVINNAIVLIDRIKIELEEFKRSHTDAIVMAAQQRFRPILLTTATTSLGLVPLWLGGGLMFEPMAIAILFGLLFATGLTLLFLPVLYKLFYKVSFKGYR
jgi:multidrug efflux pump subunit AcrB